MSEEFAPGSFVLSHDSLTGTMQKMHFTTDNKIVLETTAQIDEIAERAKAARNEISRTEKLPDGMVRVASLPMLVYLDLKKKGILQDRTALRKWLASEEAAPFRTHWVAS
jgi:hypothetical protein